MFDYITIDRYFDINPQNVKIEKFHAQGCEHCSIFTFCGFQNIDCYIIEYRFLHFSNIDRDIMSKYRNR